MKNFITFFLLVAFNLKVILSFEGYPDIFINASSSNTVITYTTTVALARLGYSVNSAGDIDGDGYKDFLICSMGMVAVKGTVYVLYGGKAPLEDVDLGSGLQSSQGFAIYGSTAGDQFGWSANTAGDVNGDGVDDIIIGANILNTNGPDAGVAYVIFGKKGGFSADIDLSNGLPISEGFTILGAGTPNNFGKSVSKAGDVNGDTVDDIIIGATGSATTIGITYVIYGSKTMTSNLIDLSGGLSLSQGFRILGASTGCMLGISVMNAGDINGDGRDDVIIGSHRESNNGAAYVIYGRSSNFPGDIDLSQGLPQTEGFTITGVNPSDFLGYSVSQAGDVNGDGIDDVIVGAYGVNNLDGMVYVIYGKKGGLTDFDLNNGLDVSQGYAVEGRSALGQKFGYYVACAGDINRDGISDMILGSAWTGNFGIAFIVFGKNGKSQGKIDLSQGLAADQGYTIYGVAAGDGFGKAVSGVGDMNNDGIDDVLIGSGTFNVVKGAAYVIFSPYLCEEHCAKCSWSWVCSKCEPGYGLYNEKCVICPSSTQLKDGVCIKPSLAEALETTTKMLGASSVAARALSMGSSVSVGLGLIAKMIQNVRFMNISYASETITAFESYDSDLFDLSIPTSFLTGVQTRSLSEIYVRYDMSPSFLENYLSSILMMFICIGVYVPTRCLLGLQKNADKKGLNYLTLKGLSKTAINFLIVQIYSNLDDIIFYLILDIKTTQFKKGYAVISTLAAFLFLFVGIGFCWFNYWLVYRYQALKNNESILAQFKKKFEVVATFFEDFKDGSVSQQSFFALLILRSALLIIIIVLFEPPLIQAILMMSLNLIFAGYLGCKRPFESLFNEITQYFCELAVFVAYTCVFVLSILDFNSIEAASSRKNLGQAIILTGTVLSLGGFIIQMIQTFGTLYEGYKFLKNYFNSNKKSIAPMSRRPLSINRSNPQDLNSQKVHLESENCPPQYIMASLFQDKNSNNASQHTAFDSSLMIPNHRLSGSLDSSSEREMSSIETRNKDRNSLGLSRRKIVRIRDSRRIDVDSSNRAQLQRLETSSNMLLVNSESSMVVTTEPGEINQLQNLKRTNQDIEILDFDAKK